MRRTLLVALTVAIVGCVNVATVEQINSDGEMGMEAYLVKKYDLAEFLLLSALNAKHERGKYLGAPGVFDDAIKWKHTLAAIYWETGRDYELLDFVQTQLPKNEADHWYCLTLERHKHLQQAEACWAQLEDERRRRRNNRMRIYEEYRSAETPR